MSSVACNLHPVNYRTASDTCGHTSQQSSNGTNVDTPVYFMWERRNLSCLNIHWVFREIIHDNWSTPVSLRTSSIPALFSRMVLKCFVLWALQLKDPFFFFDCCFSSAHLHQHCSTSGRGAEQDREDRVHWVQRDSMSPGETSQPAAHRRYHNTIHKDKRATNGTFAQIVDVKYIEWIFVFAYYHHAASHTSLKPKVKFLHGSKQQSRWLCAEMCVDYDLQ